MKQNFTRNLITQCFSFSGKLLWALYLCLICIVNYSNAQTSETSTWNNVAIGGGGFVSGIITSKKQPGLIYARTDVGGAYRWDASTSKWIPLMDWASDQQQGLFGTESLATDPQNANIVYISAGISYFNDGKSYILRSTDYGANFTITDVTAQFKIHGNGMGRHNGEKLQVDPNLSTTLYCGSRWNGLFKSTNSGSTWTRLASLNVTTTPNENGISFVLLDKSSAAVGSATQRVFVGVSRAGNSQNLYMSTNGGSTFSALVNSALPADLMPQRAILSGDGNMFVTYGDGAGPHAHWALPSEDYTSGQIWKYNIAANSWTNVTPANMNRAFSGISVDPANPQRLIASTTNTYLLQQGSAYGDRFFISTNGGASWTDIIASRGFALNSNGVSWVSTQSIHWAGSIEFDPSNTNRVFVTSGNGIFVNEDINTSNVWKFQASGLEETVPLNAVSITGGPLISAIFDYDGFRHTNVTQYSPIHTPRIGSTTGLDYGVTNKNKVVRVGYAMFYSNDMGITWTETAVINGAKGQVAVSADGNTILHCPDGSAVTYRTTNNGGSWTSVSGLSFSNARPVADGLNSSKFYAYDNSTANLYVSTNGGTSFAAAGSPGSGGSKVIRTVPGREGHIWVALFGGGLSRSTNSGSTFTKITSVSHCEAVGIGKAASGSAYETIYIYGTVGGILGVHRSIDQGASWIRVNDDDHEYGGPANGQFVIGDMNVFGRVYMSTAGRGLVYGESTTTSNLTVTPGTLTYTASSGSQSVSVSSDVSWTVSSNQSWLTTSVASGSNNGTFNVNVSQNTTSSSRTGTVTVTGSGITRTISISQNAPCTPTTIVPYIQVNSGSWTQTSTASVPAGGTVRMGPQPATGGSWRWTGPNGYTATIREITVSSFEASKAGNYIAYYTNTSGCISSHTFTIYADNNLTVTPGTLTYTASSGSQSVSVSSNVSWTVSSNQPWLTTSVASGSNNGTFNVNVSQNTTSSSRTGTVTVAGSGITRSISVSQNASCTPTTIVPYIQVNTGSWMQTSTASVPAGGTVRMGPQPATGGSWRWTGPNGYTAAVREITVSSFQASKAGNYIAYYTNTSGCISSHTFTISLSGTAIAAANNPTVVLSIEPQATETPSIMVYPNPVENKVTISVPKEFLGAKMILTNISGSVVYDNTISDINSILDMSKMQTGIYILKVNGNNKKSLSSKILKN